MNLEAFSAIRNLVIYRNLLNDPLFKLCLAMDSDTVTEEQQLENYSRISYMLFMYYDERPMLDNIWQNYILGKMINDQNPFSLACEQFPVKDLNPSLLEAARYDLIILKKLLHFDWTVLGQALGLPSQDWFQTQVANMQERTGYFYALRQLAAEMSNPDILPVFTSFYHQYGCGLIAAYRAFRWGNGLIGISYPDPVRMDDLIGYERQKQELIENTEAFLKRKGGNHVLLYGDRGTGKSSSVKALLNQYDQLRMIEMDRKQLSELNNLIEQLRKRSGSYIIFIDDLSFEDFEVEYKYLKSHIEGSLQAPAENVRLYVTSNRRHLIRETWHDRENNDEIHSRDAQQEKLSFADRFGLTLTYTSPDQEAYLNMVHEMARQEGLNIDQANLDRLAIQWEMYYHGRSGRTARQFINGLKAKMY